MKEVNSWLDVCNLENLNKFIMHCSKLGGYTGKIDRFYTCEKAGIGECIIAEFHNTNQICITPYGIAKAIDNSYLKKRIFFKKSAKAFEVVYPYEYGGVDELSLEWVKYLAYLNKDNVINGETYLQNLEFICKFNMRRDASRQIEKIKAKMNSQFDTLDCFIEKTKLDFKLDKLDV